MDPEAAVDRLRALSKEIDQTLATEDNALVFANLAEEMSQVWDGLDSWIKSGGRLPEDWTAARAPKLVEPDGGPGDSAMDRDDYWDFTRATPPEDEYGYTYVPEADGTRDPRYFKVRISATDAIEAIMRAVQVSNRRDDCLSPIGVGAEEIESDLWWVQLEGE